jgi:hypothetical protein
MRGFIGQKEPFSSFKAALLKKINILAAILQVFL